MKGRGGRGEDREVRCGRRGPGGGDSRKWVLRAGPV